MECEHKNTIAKKYPIGAGYYGHCEDCLANGPYANYNTEAVELLRAGKLECSFNHKLHQDKDDLCPACGEIINPNF